MTRLSLRFLPALAVMIAAAPVAAQTGIAINNDGRGAHASAILDVSSNFAFPTQQKGMLIPRMDGAQRLGMPSPAQGLVVYQHSLYVPLNQPAGFYYFESGAWARLDNGANNWDLGGNDITTAANDFFGTRNDVDVTFKTSGVTQMTLKGTSTARYLGINTTTPDEVVDVNGAIRIYTPVVTPGSTPYSATTTTPGVILFRPPGDTLKATIDPAGLQDRNSVMSTGHYGQTSTTSWNLTGEIGSSGGWRKLENDYEERFQKTYNQQGSPTCAAGFVEIPNGVAPIAANLTSNAGLTASQRSLISPYAGFDQNPAPRIRHQHMFLVSELNVEKNQLGINSLGLPAVPTATGGLCAGQAINSIGFYSAAGGGQRSLANFIITIKHAPFGLNNLNAGFENSADPTQGCYVLLTPATLRPSVTGAWETFTPLTPGAGFVWDGLRNIIVEITWACTSPTTVVLPPVLYYATPGGLNLTAAWNVLSTTTPATCNVSSVTPGVCNTAAPAGMPWNNTVFCGTLNGPIFPSGGVAAFRPVLRFGGMVSSTVASPYTSSNDAYLFYRGSLLSEGTSSTASAWGRQITPYYSYRGPGTISAERGVFDNSVELNDHVFDRAFDGTVKPEDAARFGERRNLSIEEMAAFTESNRHLPTMKGRDKWRAERGFSLGDLTNQLWTTAETQALYLTELNDRLDVIELLTTDRPLHADEVAVAKTNLFRMAAYTDAEKAALARTLEERTVPTQQR